jgi:hypothetical protein
MIRDEHRAITTFTHSIGSGGRGHGVVARGWVPRPSGGIRVGRFIDLDDHEALRNTPEFTPQCTLVERQATGIL